MRNFLSQAYVLKCTNSEVGCYKSSPWTCLVGLLPSTKCLLVVAFQLFSGSNFVSLPSLQICHPWPGPFFALPIFPIIVLQFEAAAYVLTKEEGGRHKPFFSKYRPQFYFRTADVTGEVILAEDGAMVMPGDDATLQVELIHPVPMEPGLRFAMREGGRTIGSGVVSSITE